MGIIGPNWEKKFPPDTINTPKSPYFLPQLAPAILNLIQYGFVTYQNVLWTKMDTFWALWDQFGRTSLQRSAKIHQNNHIFTRMGPGDLEFEPMWLCDTPKCSMGTDGHILGIGLGHYRTKLGEKVSTGHHKSTKITIFFTTIGPHDLEFDPIRISNMPK
jgi:hypothetical protein